MNQNSTSTGSVTLRRVAPVLLPGVMVILGAFAVIRYGVSPTLTQILDNVHWTVSYALAAVLAWWGVQAAPDDARAARRWFALGLSAYAFGQMVWDVQVASGWNPFPGPSDIFYSCLGPGCLLGLWASLRVHCSKEQLRTALLDASTLAVAVLVLTLSLYLPKQGSTGPLALAVLVAYPVTLLGALCVGVILILSLRARTDRNWLVFILALLAQGMVWMHWNSLTLDDTLQDGTWFNFTFSVAAVGSGLGAMWWRPQRSTGPRWERVCEWLLRVLPVLSVVIAAASLLVLQQLPPISRAMQLLIGLGVAAVIALAMARQSLLLAERDRLLAAEQRARASEQRFKTLVESAHDAIFLLSETELIDCNPRALEMFGARREQIIGQPPVLLSAPIQAGGHTAAEAAQVYFTETQEGRTPEFAWRSRRLDGTVFDTEVSLNPIVIGDRMLMQAIIRDISGRRQLEEQLRQSQKMEAIGQLSGGIAHDFNNLLTAIIGHLGLLRGNPQVTPQIAESLDEISAAANRAAKLTSQLLSFSRRQVISISPLDLNEVVTNLSKMLRRVLGEPVAVQLDFTPEPLTFRGDAGMMEQVLVNLAVNARDAMPEGGTLRITTRRETRVPPASDGGGAAGPVEFARLSVSDTGTGIPAEIRARIFEPFFTTKGVGKGTGLGLATVFGIMQQHHGWIEVDSEVGRGTTFRLYLPLVAHMTGIEPVVEPAQPAQPARGRGEVILLVEDEAAVQQIVMSALARYGYRVLLAANGPEALKIWAARKAEIALLLTDLIMPEGISGLQLARQLLGEKPLLRVVYTSGYSAEIAGKEMKLTDGVNYLAKPYELERLYRTVRAALDRKQSRSPF